MTLTAGTRLGPYEVVALIGAGGMGEVYRARDPRLGRDVAIKVLPRQYAADEDRLRRFEQEARAASALNHPNILVVHDVGTDEGIPYLVEELLEGESLRERLRGGALPVGKAVDIAVQMAHALAAAHEKGIVHRDLKPENVFVTRGGHVKILDFGLAKLVERAPALAGTADASTFAGATGAGLVLGTVGYMAPEQARGLAADHRADIFALGCVLYEMLAGRRAFAGDTAADTVTALLSRDPPPLSGFGSGTPAGLQGIVRRSLEKRPADRFSSAHDLALALQAVAEALVTGHPSVEVPVKSIVVLPFENLSPDPENAYFADGLTEELIADLSKLGALRVISRTSAMLLKGSKKDAPTIARDLNVRYVLEGSVRRAGSSLRITAQLIDAPADAHLWAEKYTGALDDVFDIQERVARAITEALEVRLTVNEDRLIAKRAIPSIQVYDCFLKARSAFNNYSEAGLREAERLLLEGLKIAGENALLLAGLGRVHFEYVGGCLAGEEGLDEAEAFARRALALDPDCAPALLTLGISQHLRGNLVETVRLLRRALQADPGDTDSLWWLAWIGSWITGQTVDAMRAARRLVEMDPGSSLSHGAVALVLFVEGRLDEALAAGEGQPLDLWSRWFRALILVSAGRDAEAVSVLEPVEPEEGFYIARDYALFLKYVLRGEPHRIPELLRPELVRMAELDACTAVFFAMYYSVAGDTDSALDWLEKAVPRGYFNYPFWCTHHRFAAPLRGHPRFERLMNVMKEKWLAFRAQA
jgi:serine/threonine protein kinase